jgi:P-type Ca2+ transporter type 2C
VGRPLVATLTVGPPRRVVVPVSTAVRGRARFRVDAIRGRPALAGQLASHLTRLDAVQAVRVNQLTGSVLVHFEADRLTVDDLLRDLDRMASASAARNGQPPRLDLTAIATQGGLQHAWHAVDAIRALDDLAVVPERGLSSAEAKARLGHHGPNRLPSPEPRSGLAILADQVTSLPVALLAGAAVLSAVSGAMFDAAVIVGVVALNAIIGYVTESRVERILTSLQQLTSPAVSVRRDGKESLVPASSLVPGDIMVLRAGHDVHADGRIIEMLAPLTVSESALTGESFPVRKVVGSIHPEDTPLADRDNRVFAGTVVSEGSGLALVTATGRRTELGRIRALIAETEAPATPLESHLAVLGRNLVGLTLGLSALTLGLGLLRGAGLLQMMRTSISLAVAAVPEGLPTVATTTLALGMHRMLRRNVLVRKLEIIESLGAATVICADKTGTLTENRMTVLGWALNGSPFISLEEVATRRAAAGGPTLEAGADPRLARAVLVGVLCNEAELHPVNGGWMLEGSPTEGALLEAARAVGLDYREARNARPMRERRDRGEGQNWMATVHDAGTGRTLVAVKGAPEEVIRLCVAQLGPDGELRPMTPEARRTALTTNARMAGDAMRVLGLAYGDRETGTGPSYDRLVWIGLVGMADPVRPGVREAIAACRRAGIRIVMVTGDQSPTAIAVGRALGLVSDGQIRVLEATALAQVNRETLQGLAREVDIFARVSPVHKYEIVRALQASGHVVAMTGDGVNDGPALRAADIGVAMGARGTELARDLGDVILLDDDFGSMVGAIEHGRAIHTNVRKALRFLLSTNLSEILVTMAAMVGGLATPLTAVQLLWINLLSDVLPALALAVEPAEPGVMDTSPRDATESILSRPALLRIGTDAGLIATASLGAYGLGLARHGAGPVASTVAFSTLTAAQLFHALSCRSDRRSGVADLRRSPFTLGAVGGTLALQAAAVTLPPLRRLLGTAPLGILDWLVVAGGSLLPLAVREIEKARPRPALTARVRTS